jgi:K+-sensing histidine kinase KdpD
MADLAQPSTDASARRFLARWDRQFQSLQSPTVRYSLAIISVAVALGLSLVLQYYQFRGVEVPVLSLAIAVTTWYAGNGPAVVAIVLSSLCFDYFFAEPYYSLEITTRDLPYFFIFVIWGLIVAGFSTVRRQVEESLRQAQEELAKRAVELQAANKSWKRSLTPYLRFRSARRGSGDRGSEDRRHRLCIEERAIEARAVGKTGAARGRR